MRQSVRKASGEPDVAKKGNFSGENKAESIEGSRFGQQTASHLAGRGNPKTPGRKGAKKQRRNLNRVYTSGPHEHPFARSSRFPRERLVKKKRESKKSAEQGTKPQDREKCSVGLSRGGGFRMRNLRVSALHTGIQERNEALKGEIRLRRGRGVRKASTKSVGLEYVCGVGVPPEA